MKTAPLDLTSTIFTIPQPSSKDNLFNFRLQLIQPIWTSSTWSNRHLDNSPMRRNWHFEHRMEMVVVSQGYLLLLRIIFVSVWKPRWQVLPPKLVPSSAFSRFPFWIDPWNPQTSREIQCGMEWILDQCPMTVMRWLPCNTPCRSLYYFAV